MLNSPNKIDVLKTLRINRLIMPPWQILILQEVSQKTWICKFCFGLLGHVHEGRYVLRSGDGECFDNSSVHWVLQDGIKSMRTLISRCCTVGE